MCLCAALQANVIPKPDGMAWHCIALHYIDWDEDDEVGTRDCTAVAGALQQEVIYLEEDLKRQEKSNDLRRAVLPVRLMEQTEMEISKSQSASAARLRVALELAQRL
ncbi:hypothetical protein CY35_07G082500 [Sphagnum magellanicum]|uniref:Uncharacterized protein n=1 Tax=Sphagnum magellanicum TaxID=128215 RepID=A0ACB8HMD2_9BRYO|nr:hypothetical protein CY35_07G082500 [Sphagnum magellanicum]